MLKKLGYLQVMAVDLSYRLGWIDDSLVKRVRNILELAKLPTAPPETMTVEMFKSIMAVRELVCHSLSLQKFPFFLIFIMFTSLLDSYYSFCYGRLIRR